MSAKSWLRRSIGAVLMFLSMFVLASIVHVMIHYWVEPAPVAEQPEPVEILDVAVLERTLEWLEFEEGFRADIYLDSVGVRTIGFGTAIGQGITRREAKYLLHERLTITRDRLNRNLPWLSDAPRGQQSAIMGMGYQLGVRGLLGFRIMLAALEVGDCPAAQAAALDSNWARKTPARAERVTAILCG